MASNSVKKPWSIWKKIGLVLLLIIAYFAINIVYVFWDISEIKSLCKAITPGTPISEMKSAISNHGGQLFKGGSFKLMDEEDKWVVHICATSTMCESSCKIYHNSTEVIEATLGESTISEVSRGGDNAKPVTEINPEKLNKIISTHVANVSGEKNDLTSEKSIAGSEYKPVATAPVAAQFLEKSDYVSFWQTNYLLGNQGGCTVEFMFGSNTLTTPIEKLTFKVHLLDKNGKKLGMGSFSLLEPIGGSSADSYRTSVFNGIRIKNPKEDGEYSPLCLNGVSIVVDEAVGMQGGNKVELVRYNQLRYTTRKSVNVRVKERTDYPNNKYQNVTQNLKR